MKLDLVITTSAKQFQDFTFWVGHDTFHVHWSDGPAGWVRSDQVTIFPDFGGSGQHFGCISFPLVIYWYLNQYESSNTTLGSIDFLRYLILYNN